MSEQRNIDSCAHVRAAIDAPTGQHRPELPRRYLAIIISCAVLVALLAAGILNLAYRQQLEYWREKLTRVADVDQQVLERWVAEREQDARLLASFPSSQIAVLDRPVRRPGRASAWQRQVQEELSFVADTYGYAGTYVLDGSGKVQAKSYSSPPLSPEVAQFGIGASVRMILTIPAAQNQAGYSQVAFISPIRKGERTNSTAEAARTIGYIVLLTRFDEISKLLLSDAGATETGETVLVVLQAGKPAFISPLRHWKKGQPAPEPAAKTPAYMCLQERRALFGNYRDYRGVPVVAAARYLPELGWGMVTKVDRAEALAAFQTTLILGICVASVLIMAIVSAALAWLRQQRVQRLQADLVLGKEKQMSLRQAEERFWVALQNSPVVVFNQDRELRYTWINNPQPPWSEQQWKGKTDEELIGAEDGGRLSALKRPVLETGVGVRKEWSFVCRGEKKHYDINVQPLLDSRGEIVGITCASIDVTERKRMEEQLKESERRYRRLFESTEAFAETNMAGNLRAVNPAFERMIGYSEKELLKLSYQDLTPPLWHAMEDNIVREQVLRRGYSDIYEKEYRRKDGTLLPAELRVFLIRDEGNQPAGMLAAVRDIGRRKKAEEHLRDYGKVVEGLQEMIVVVDREYRCLIANRAYLDYRGMKREQVIGHLLPEILDKDVFERIVKPRFEECLRGKIVTFEMTCVYPRLGQRDLSLSYFPIEGRNGVDRIACVMQDITGQRRAAEALGASETRYRLLFERNPAGMYRCTLEGKLLDCNEAFARILGCDSREEALQFPISHFYVHPQERDGFVSLICQRGKVSDYELCGRRKDGSRIWILVNVAVVAGENGGPDVLEGAFVDITARKNAEEAVQRSENQLRAFMEHAPYGIFRYAKDRFLSANPALVRMLGYNTEKEVTALKVSSDVFSEQAECRDLLQLSGQRAHFGPLETRWKFRDGRPILVRLSGRVTAGPQNDHLLMEAIVEDVTRQHSLEEHLRQADKMEALGRLASGVAHDFNNLLLGITLNLEHAIKQLAAGDGNQFLQQELEEALQAAKNAGAVTRQLLVFGRKRTLQQERVNMNEVVVRSQDLMRRLAGENVYVNVRLGEGLGAVTADPVQLQQVILNLITNARDAMQGGGEITVRTAHLELDTPPPDEYFTAPPKPGSYVVLEVSDTGGGISPPALSHIFEPFFTTKEEGSGLGLSTSYGIVTQSGGYMSAGSQAGRGTSIRLYLPQQQVGSAMKKSA